MSDAFSTLSNVLNKSQLRDEDECDLFGKLVAKRLRKRPETEREKLMYKIDTLFFKGLSDPISFSPQTTPIPSRPSSAYSTHSEPLSPQSKVIVLSNDHDEYCSYPDNIEYVDDCPFASQTINKEEEIIAPQSTNQNSTFKIMQHKKFVPGKNIIDTALLNAYYAKLNNSK